MDSAKSAQLDGYSYEDAIGKDVVELLRNTFAASEMDVDIRMVCNDAVGVLCAGRYTDPSTEIGVVLGTGTNASCMETVEDIRTWTPGLPNDLRVPVNIEWGGFTSDVLPCTPHDKELDKNSDSPGNFQFENMVCGRTVGELCRLVIVSLCREGALLRTSRMGDLDKPYSISGNTVREICSDATSGHVKSIGILKSNLNVVVTATEMYAIRRVCDVVVDRAALLMGCALAATISHVRRGERNSTRRVLVAVDGSMFIKFEKLRKNISSETNRILSLVYGDKAPKFELLPYLGGSSFGAAALAAASCPEKTRPAEAALYPELGYLDQ